MRERVLLADADPVERAHLEATLADAGYEVVTADNAATLIRAAEEHRPSVILLAAEFGGRADQPAELAGTNIGGSGQALCRHIKASPPLRATSVILICGRGEPLLPTAGSDGRPDEVLVRPLHPPEVAIRLAAMQRIQHYASEVVQSSKMDSLTGTFNNSYLIERLRHEVLRAARYGRCVAIVLIDLDGFATLNTREGATVGDLVLREVARALTSRLRGVDLVARSGPDEFSIVLPETSLLVARPVAERLRLSIAGLSHLSVGDERRRLQITASLGIAGLPHPEVNDVPDLLRCARTALARARDGGGDRSILY
jgi:diguanylate cyclase (GGDEF)-like protein